MLLIGPDPTPSILEQTRWPVGFYKFRDETPENEYFNPAVVEWRGRDILIVRRRVGPLAKSGINSLEAWNLKGNVPYRRNIIKVPGAAANESYEDPRAFMRGDAIIVSCCNFVFGDGFAHQCMFGVHPKENFRAEMPLRLAFGKNANLRQNNTGHEKNWAPFIYDGRIHISYALDEGRHVVLKTQGGKPMEIFYGKSQLWPWGSVRGGTSPVLVNGLYWTFFHSSHHWYCGKRQYHMAALAFEPKPPFNVVRMARSPLLSGSERDFRHGHEPLCVFPCGAIHRRGEWLVTLGINDNRCAWLRIPHAELEKLSYVC